MLWPILSSYFKSGVRSRGAEYAATGHVTNCTVSPKMVAAIVEGTADYDVCVKRFVRKGGWDLLADCMCDFAYENDSTCKHVWAMLIHAEKEIARVWGAVPNDVRMIHGDDDEEDEYEYEDDAEPSAPSSNNGSGGLQIRLLSGPPGQGGKPLGVLDGGGFQNLTDLQRQIMQLVSGGASEPTVRAHAQQPKKPSVPAWQRLLEETRPEHRGYYGYSASKPQGAINSPMWYVIDREKSRFGRAIILELMQRKERGKGAPESPGFVGKLVKQTIMAEDIDRIVDADDRWICALLVGAARPGRDSNAYSYYYRRSEQRVAQWQLDPSLVHLVMPRLMGTGRLLWRENQEAPAAPATWSPAPPWELALRLSPSEGKAKDKGKAVIQPILQRSGHDPLRVPLAEIPLVVNGDPGTVMYRGELAPLRVAGGEARGLLSWAEEVSTRPPALVDRGELEALLAGLSAKKIALPIVWPEGWGPKQLAGVKPQPRLTLTTPKENVNQRTTRGSLAAKVTYEYEGVAADPAGGLYVTVKQPDGSSVLVQRDADVERLAVERFLELGGKKYGYDESLELHANRVPAVVTGLLAEGWHVVRDAASFRKPGAISVHISSGIDWFDLEGAAQFDGQSASIADVLAALKRDERFVSLGDGSLGLLPEEWLEKYGRWLGLGRAEGDGVRFGKAQLSLVDALIDSMPEATCDEQVMAARAKLSTFAGIKPRTEPRTFKGELRGYQRQGLGWLSFLAEFGLGGCLADDMGLGKTVQLLAHLLDQRKQGQTGPWLVVAPKSLVLNWAKEAERFTPTLRVIDYTGLEREGVRDKLAGADLVLTTYATMRLDIEPLREVEFGCVVLDEAQTIKNATSQAAKASRLLKARRRLALTGTPVENRLEDLWSIFEFLNPGMLGSTQAFRAVANSGKERDGDENGGGGGNGENGVGGMEMLRRALRPFLLRRTKAMVAPELPSRTEQTIQCQLEGKQKKLYEELRTHYQQQLLGRVDREGMNKSKMHVLEALLRLRQAACHPGLIEPKLAPAKGRAKKSGAMPSDSAKVATLMTMLEELSGEGNKALVFSQFTSLLALVRVELDRRGIVYEELDGTTSAKDRAERVERFQSTSVKDGGRPVFLISLKAGGVGLNLTAAGYVFLLDPWWNPAVEAQAIDRTHRIGQDKQVMAYRLIATGTVEERILELQNKKRELASAIISENAGPLSAMTRDDLEWLLS